MTPPARLTVTPVPFLPLWRWDVTVTGAIVDRARHGYALTEDHAWRAADRARADLLTNPHRGGRWRPRP